MYIRPVNQLLLSRLKESRRFIQVVAGPRQVGKTTLLKQILKTIDMPSHYASADVPSLQDIPWLEQQWEIGRFKTRQQSSQRIPGLLVLDEVQKIPSWSERIKKLWDEDTFEDIPLQVVILGSAPLLIQKGLTETLAGRFELTQMTHWSFREMQDAFDWTLEQYIYFGGYPGSAALVKDEKRWMEYVQHSLIETNISRDILLMTRVDKPALLRRLFELGCRYSGQILSYQKMLGQLSDVGNVTTLAHYLKLLSGAGMLTGIEKYSNKLVMQKASSPKLQVLNTSLISSQNPISFKSALDDLEYWGRLVESTVGAHLYNEGLKDKLGLYYWRERNKEVDFVLQHGEKLIAIEVKSGTKKTLGSGMTEFIKKYPVQKILLVGGDGIKLAEYLKHDLLYWFD